MKKMRIFLPVAIALFGVLFFSQCKKDTGCTLRLTCCYPTNGTKDSLAADVLIEFDTSHYDYTNHDIDSLISCVNFGLDSLNDEEVLGYQKDSYYEEFRTNENGVFTYHLPNPALLIVKATKVDSIKDNVTGNFKYVRYTATDNVKLEANETTDVKLIIRPN